MDNGYIRLYRSFLEWEWYSEPNVVIVFLHLLLKARYKASQYKGVTVERGEIVISNQKIASETGLTVQQVKTALKKLIATQSVTYRKSGKTRIISIENYDKFQTATQSATSNQPQNNLKITSNQPAYINNKGRKKESNIYNSTQKRKSDASYDIEELMVIK